MSTLICVQKLSMEYGATSRNICIYTHTYIYIYIEREKERERIYIIESIYNNPVKKLHLPDKRRPFEIGFCLFVSLWLILF